MSVKQVEHITFSFNGFTVPFTNLYLGIVDSDSFNKDVKWWIFPFIIALCILALYKGNFLNILAVYGVLIFTTFIHELGHYITARFYKVRIKCAWVNELLFKMIFFPSNTNPTKKNILAFSWKACGGGAVSMVEEDYDKTNRLQRFLITFAGPAFNYIAAFAAFLLMGYFNVTLGYSVEEHELLFLVLVAVLLLNLVTGFTNMFFGSDGKTMWRILKNTEELEISK